MAEPTLLIAGGEVVDVDGRRRADVWVAGGLITDVTEPGVVPAATGAGTNAEHHSGDPVVIDATGCVVVPGLVDLCARLGQPGNEQAETVATGSIAAALGGFTTVLSQPDTNPPLDSVEALAEARRLGSDAPVRITNAATLTSSRAGSQMAPLAELADAGVTWFTDSGPVADARLLLRALRYGLPLGVTVAVQPTEPSLAAGAVMAEGPTSSWLGLVGEPAVGEEVAVASAIALARSSGGRIHLDRISSAAAVDAVRAAKHEGVAVSCSVTADHLLFTDADCAAFDPLMRNTPPYRTELDRQALRDGLVDGTIDAIVSGHSPAPPEAVDVPFALAHPGVIGLQTAFAVAVGDAGIDLEVALAALSWQPMALLAGGGSAPACGARVAAGSPADLAVVDPTERWKLEPAQLASAATNTPHLGRELTGRVRHTICEGLVVVTNAKSAPPNAKPAPQGGGAR